MDAGAHPPESPRRALATAAVVPQHSTRRATARRASRRRATARQRKDDVDGCVIAYLKGHPQSTIGDIAKALNADRDTIAAGVAHTVWSSEGAKASKGYAAT